MVVAGCAAKLLLPWLSAFALTGHSDALQLAKAADMFTVPHTLMWAIAYEETRYNASNTQVSVAGAHGRMQVMPLYWHWQCGRVLGRRFAERNRACGALILKFYLDRCSGDTYCAANHYVGGDARYAREVGFRSLVIALKMRTLWPDSPSELLPP